MLPPPFDQINSTQLNPTHLDFTQLNSTQVFLLKDFFSRIPRKSQHHSSKSPQKKNAIPNIITASTMVYNSTLVSKSDVRSPDYNLGKPKMNTPHQGLIIFLVLLGIFIFVVGLIFSGYAGSCRNCCGKRKSAREDNIDAAERGEWEMAETPGQKVRRLGVEKELQKVFDIDEYLAGETPRDRTLPRPSSEFQEVNLDRRGPSPALPRDMVAHHGSVQPLHRASTGKEDWPLHQGVRYSRTSRSMTPKERLQERMNGERVQERMNGDRWA